MIDTDTDLPEIMLPHEVAKLLRTTTNSLAQDRYLHRGVPFIKAGRRILYARTDILNYLAGNKVEVPTA